MLFIYLYDGNLYSDLWKSDVHLDLPNLKFSIIILPQNSTLLAVVGTDFHFPRRLKSKNSIVTFSLACVAGAWKQWAQAPATQATFSLLGTSHAAGRAFLPLARFWRIVEYALHASTMQFRTQA